MLLRGPRVPTGTIVKPASHVDLLPTLLHLLGGRPLEVAHAHGRDFLASDWPDQMLLAKPGSPTRAILFRGSTGLDLTLTLDSPRLVTHGLTGPDAKPDPALRVRPEDAAAWIKALAQELERLTR